MKQSALLEKAWVILAEPGVWCDTAYALDGLDKVTSPTSKDAVRFDPVGAIHKAYKGPDRIKEVDATLTTLKASIAPRLPKEIFAANKALHSDQIALKAWFDRAIHVAKMEGN